MPEEKQKLEGGAYEVIRARLEKGGGELQSRLTDLNAQRQEVFGAVETELVSTERVSTEHNCVPRDIIAVGHNRFIFGYNIQFGLKATTAIEDVFSAYDYDPESHTFSAADVSEVFADPSFSLTCPPIHGYGRRTDSGQRPPLFELRNHKQRQKI